MTSAQTQDGSNEILPGFTPMDDVLSRRVKTGNKVKVMGLVTDFRSPIPTQFDDWKCQMQLYDFSCQHDAEATLYFNIFCPKEDMPEATLGDVVMIVNANVQSFRGDSPSLLTHFTTDIIVYKANKIPRPPGDASVAMMQGKKALKHRPTKAENAFIPSFYHNIAKERLPTLVEFETRVVQSVNMRDKFRELKDVSDGKFHDLVVQLVRQPFEQGNKMELWVSDYTENSAFFNHTIPLGKTTPAPKKGTSTTNAWTGPFGKRSMQVTCYEPHASVIRAGKLGENSWVLMRNVQIKYGRNMANLEGFLREDRQAHGTKIQLSHLDPAADPENIKPELKEAIRRKRDYERLKREQKKSLDDAGRAGQKRKAALDMNSRAESPGKDNAKKKRRKQRAETFKKAEQENDTSLIVRNLNNSVKYENQNKAPSLVADIIAQHPYETTLDGQTITMKLPFVNLNYRTQVRVVNFLPSRLEGFACEKKKSSEFDVLSDNDEQDDDSGSEKDMMTKFTADTTWEWRFFLELEDAVVDDKQQKNRVWVLVDNQAAQCLMNLDASDLGRDREKLDALRQRMFLLWGDLEERKRRQAAEGKANHQKGCPPPDSSDVEEVEKKKDGKAEEVTNLPFSCCIRQYGVKLSEEDPSKADAGSGKRWERMFGLFGTLISAA